MGQPQGLAAQVDLFAQGYPPGFGLQKQGLEQAAGHAAKGHPCGAGVIREKGKAGSIGTACQLQGARRRPGADRLEKGHRRPGGAHAHITTHGPAIQLPEGPKTRLT